MTASSENYEAIRGWAEDLPAAADGVNQGEPRDVLVDRISTWVEEDEGVYNYADRLILDLYQAGYAITSRAAEQRWEKENADRMAWVRKRLTNHNIPATDEQIAEALDDAEARDLAQLAFQRIKNLHILRSNPSEGSVANGEPS